MEKSQIKIAQEEIRVQLLQVRNLSDVYGFDFDAEKLGNNHIILCGQKRRWGNAYKRFAVTSSSDRLLADIKQIIESGGKVFGIQ